MKAFILFLLLTAPLLSQQPNSDGAYLFTQDTMTSVQTGANVGPGPHIWQLPSNAGSFWLWRSGRPGQQHFTYVSNALQVGSFVLPAGYIDISLSAAVLLDVGFFTGTWIGCPVPPWCPTAGIGIPIYYDAQSSWSIAAQMVTIDPVSPNGYSISSALFLWR
jgi:hypothetical protein